MNKFDCPKCQQQINAQDRQAQTPMTCPECNESITVPTPATTASPIFEDLFDGDDSLLDQIKASNPTTGPTGATASDQLPPESTEPVEPIKVHPEDSSDDYQDIQFPADSAPNSAPTVPSAPVAPQAVAKNEAANSTNDTKKKEVNPAPRSNPQATSKPNQQEATDDEDPDPPITFTIQCPVCNSHLFVTTAAVGSQAKCADCFSAITVPAPTPKQLQSGSKKKSHSNKSASNKSKAQTEDLELKFRDEEPAEGSAALGPDGHVGLDPVMQDLLSPTKSNQSSDGVDSQSASDDEDELKLDPVPDFADGLSPQDPRRKTKDATESDTISPYHSRSAQLAKQAKKKKLQQQPQSASADDASDRDAESGFPNFEFEPLFNAAFNLVTAPGTIVRCTIVAVLLASGNIVGHTALNNYATIANPTMGDTAVTGAWRFGLSWALFGLGTILLWYFAGVVFRKAAVGKRAIDSWEMGPSTEWTSTFLLIGFSFAVAGSPLIMFGAVWLTAPSTFFFALPMLVSVWYTQSPFRIIAVDAFARYRRERKQWATVWLVVLTFAGITFTSGLMLAVPVTILNIVTSAVGSMLLALATLGYAAVAGWHSGKVVEELS